MPMNVTKTVVLTMSAVTTTVVLMMIVDTINLVIITVMIMAITVVGIKINHQILTLSLLAPSGVFFILSNAQQISTIFDIQNQTYIVLFRYMILRVIK